MIAKKQYVVFDGDETWICTGMPLHDRGYTIYELGPKIVEPNYEPLVKWVIEHHKWMLENIPESNNLKEALKAAQIE